jgi:hypothetical protein
VSCRWNDGVVDDSFVSWPPMFLMTFLPPVRFLSGGRVCCRLVRRCRHDDDDDDDKSSIIETYERKEFRFDRGVCVVDWMSTSEEMGARLILCRRGLVVLFVFFPFHYYYCTSQYCTVGDECGNLVQLFLALVFLPFGLFSFHIIRTGTGRHTETFMYKCRTVLYCTGHDTYS